MLERLNQIGNTLKVARQESSILLQDGTRVNDVFWYHVSKDYPNQVGIHLFSTNIGNSITEGKAFLKLYKQGLSELAHRLETDPKLANIAEVSGWSKIVYERPELLKLLGFEVTERDDQKQEALAIMKREDFLKRYRQE